MGVGNEEESEFNWEYVDLEEFMRYLRQKKYFKGN